MEYVFQKKTEDMFLVWLQEKMNEKFEQKIYYATVNVKCNSNQKWKNDKCWCQCEKDYVWNPATCSCENGKCLASIIDNSVITCDEFYRKNKKIPKNFHGKNITCKR